MQDSSSKLVEVYRAGNPVEAHTIRNALESAGIPVRIEGEMLQGVIGGIPLTWDTSPCLLVDETQVDAAREILKEASREHQAEQLNLDPASELRCLACGHEMGETDHVCSACGWSFEEEQGAAPDLVDS